MTDDAIRSGVGRAVRHARTEAGMSMRALASACGVSQPFISAIESGASTPSIATLYRLAEVLGTEPASLLPSHGTDDIRVIRRHEGERMPSSDRPNSAVGRILLSDERRHLEIYEYITDASEDLDVWFDHPGEVVLHLISGRITVAFQGRPSASLDAGDCLVHPGAIPHRWTVEGTEAAHIFLAVLRG